MPSHFDTAAEYAANLPTGTLRGIAWPIASDGDDSLPYVERDDDAATFRDDDAAAHALAEMIGTRVVYGDVHGRPGSTQPVVFAPCEPAPVTRADRYAAVLRANDIPGDVAPGDDETPRRWCLTYTAWKPGEPNSAEWAAETFDALDGLQDRAADLVLDGYALEGIFDLDTGRAFGPHVSTPVVTCSEDAASAPAVVGFAACDADDIDDDARRS